MNASRCRTAVIALLGLIASAWLVPPASARSGRSAAHDFAPGTLASYVSLRFSSAVPQSVIHRLLAAEGFSQRDLDLVAAPGSPLTPHAAGPAAAIRARLIGRDVLACPPSDPTECELDTQSEPHIAANPTSPANLIGVFQDGRYPDGGAVDIGWSTSFDKGKTWKFRGDAPGLTVGGPPGPQEAGAPFERASDPVVVFDRKHDVAMLQGVAVSVRGCAIYCDSAVTVNISHNDGRTFGGPVIVHEDVSDPEQAPIYFNDKNWIAVDNHPSSPHYGRAYSAWDQPTCEETTCSATFQPVMVSYSDDGGASWSPMIQATHQQPAESHAEVGVQPLVLANGDVVIVFADVQAGVYTYYGQIEAIRSTDGGQTWSDPVVIDATDPAPEESNALRAPNVPSAAVDRSDGRIYVAWQDQRFGSGRNDIVLSSSPDGGQTWTPVVNATPGELDLDHFTPAIAAAGGTVHMTYRAHAPVSVEADPSVDAVYRALEGGLTTVGPVFLAKPSDTTVSAFTTVAAATLHFLGDYAGIAVSRRTAHPIWCQAQNFKHQDPNDTNTHQRAASAGVR
jgi:BNR repeat protein